MMGMGLRRMLVAVVLMLWSVVRAEEVVYSPEDLRTPLSLKRNPDQGCDRVPTVGMWCPEGWSLQQDAEGAVCMWLSGQAEAWSDASDICETKGGHLLSIRSQARQETVQDFLKRVPLSVWIGGRQAFNSQYYVWPAGDRVTYHNLKDGFVQVQSHYRNRLCLILKEDAQRTWAEIYHCDIPRPFVCDTSPQCYSNRLGPTCKGECHCLGELCEGGDACSAGCQEGWTGPHCCQRKLAPSVAYYCVKDSGQQTMILRLDPSTTDFQAVQSVDDQGQNQTWCQDIVVTRDPQDFTYTIRIDLNSSKNGDKDSLALQPQCGPKETGKNTFTLRLSLQEKTGLRLPFDRTVVITCDFNNAETMWRGMKYAVQSENDSEPMENLEPTREDVALEVIDPSTGDAIHQAELGTPVQLRMRLKISGDVNAQGVSPYLCTATGPGGKPERQLTDKNGCSLPEDPMSSLTGVNGTVTSRAFQVFAFPRHSTVTLSCWFQFCFAESEQPKCDDRCGYENGHNRMRRAAEKAESISTTIRILPGKGSRSVQRSESANGGSHLVSNVTGLVTWLLVVTLLLKSAKLY